MQPLSMAGRKDRLKNHMRQFFNREFMPSKAGRKDIMTKIKLCGLSRPCDMEAANALRPEYIGFIFAPESRRYISPWRALALRQMLAPTIRVVGVFVDERPEKIADMGNQGIIDVIQLHGSEDEDFIMQLRQRTDKPIIRAFRAEKAEDIINAGGSRADYILLDSGAGTGTAFDWGLIQSIKRPYFLAGGLSPDNVGDAVARLRPFAVDVSSGIETGGVKDQTKMAAFVAAVRKEDKR